MSDRKVNGSLNWGKHTRAIMDLKWLSGTADLYFFEFIVPMLIFCNDCKIDYIKFFNNNRELADAHPQWFVLKCHNYVNKKLWKEEKSMERYEDYLVEKYITLSE